MKSGTQFLQSCGKVMRNALESQKLETNEKCISADTVFDEFYRSSSFYLFANRPS